MEPNSQDTNLRIWSLMNIFIFFIQTLEQIVNYLAVFDSWKVQLFVSLFTPEAAFPGNRLYTASSCQPPGLKQTQGQICCFYVQWDLRPQGLRPTSKPEVSVGHNHISSHFIWLLFLYFGHLCWFVSLVWLFICLLIFDLVVHVRKIPWRRNGNPHQHSCLGNPMDKGAWQATSMGLQRVGHYLLTKQQQFIFKNPKCSQRVLAGLTEAV